MNRPDSWTHIPQPTRYLLILAGSLTISLAGVVLACILRKPDYATGAGAISTIMGSALSLVRPDYGRRIYEFRMKSAAWQAEGDSIKNQLSALHQWLSINADGQTYQNRAVVAAAIIGTVFWGFGNFIATYFMHQLGITPLCSC